MKEFGIYLLQMASWLAAFWLTYQLLLRKETYFELNRWFLISGLIVSMLAPLFPVRYQVLVETGVASFIETSPTVSLSTTTIENTKPDIFLVIYALGAIVSLLILFYQLFKLKLIRLSGKTIVVENQKVYQTGKDIVPFSTFGDVYIGNNLTDPDQLKCIVAHEKVHIIERHWADLLLLEMVRTLQWFNPILILYRKAMMQNHEYLADRGAIAQGISPKIYQGILANQMLGFQAISIANSFNRGNKNKRLKMMNSNKSKPIVKLKPLFLLPMVAVILFAFSKPEYTYSLENTVPQAKDGMITIKGKVVDQKGNSMPGASIILESGNQGCVSNLRGEFELANVSVDDAIIISFVGFQTTKMKVQKNMNITMNESTLKIEVKKDGAVTPPPAKKEELLILEDTPDKKDVPPPPPPNLLASYPSLSSENKPLLVVNGEISKRDINEISPAEIESINVLRNEQAIAKYGDAGKNGALELQLINTQENLEYDALNSVNKKALILMNGEATKLSLNDVRKSPTAFDKINILNSEQANSKYGEKAKFGAVELTLKEHPDTPTADKKQDNNIFIVVEEMPQYPGGQSALQAYIKQEAAKVGKQGTAIVNFTISTKGNAEGVKVVKTSGNKALDKKAVEIVEGMGNWTPGKQRGKPVSVKYNIEIEF